MQDIYRAMTIKLSKARGRPRQFDRTAALNKAMRLFWTHGYEPTSLELLTKAMGIGPPSFYAAFGDKRSLFLETIDAYQAQFGVFIFNALAEEPTALQAIERILREAATIYTDPSMPRGCMVVTAATNCSDAALEIQDDLTRRRTAGAELIQARIMRAVDEGELPCDINAMSLASFFVATLHGLSIAARDGCSRETLLAVADIAMKAWPAKAG
jgi:TetR/AcrR family transcriptional regulator, copper-responsive repressor